MAPDFSFTSVIVVFGVVLKLLESISVFVLLTHGSFVFTGTLLRRVVIVIDCSRHQQWHREIRRPFFRYLESIVRFLFEKFAHTSNWRDARVQSAQEGPHKGRAIL
jgi:hypothetical protein